MLAQEKVCQTIEELNRGQEKEKHIDISELHELLKIQVQSKRMFQLMMYVVKNKKLKAERRAHHPKKKEKW